MIGWSKYTNSWLLMRILLQGMILIFCQIELALNNTWKKSELVKSGQFWSKIWFFLSVSYILLDLRDPCIARGYISALRTEYNPWQQNEQHKLSNPLCFFLPTEHKKMYCMKWNDNGTPNCIAIQSIRIKCQKF